jgi:ABC-type transporter Mla subunit MlaD
MLGEKYIQLSHQDGPQAPPNHLFQGTNAASIGSALVMIQQFIDEAKKTIQTLNAILGSGDQSIIRNTSSSIAGIVQKLNAFLSSTNENVNLSFDNIKSVTQGLKGTVNSINLILGKITSGDGTLGMLISDKKTQKELSELINNLKQAAEKLNKSSLLNPSGDRGRRW